MSFGVGPGCQSIRLRASYMLILTIKILTDDDYKSVVFNYDPDTDLCTSSYYDKVVPIVSHYYLIQVSLRLRH